MQRKTMRNKRIWALYNDNSGSSEWVLGLFALTFIMAAMVFVIQLCAFRANSDAIEDALAASGLAAALVDVERYGIDHTLLISDPDNSYRKYVEALNVNLAAEGSSFRQKRAIEGPVRIEQFRIYNVEGDKVSEIYMNDSGNWEVTEGLLGSMEAPNGQIIQNTGVYGEIAFDLRGIMGLVFSTKKSKLVDVKSYIDWV